MARITLLLRYQWRAYWRRFAKGGGSAQSRILILGVLGWLIFVRLPPKLLSAAEDLASGGTGRVDLILSVFAAGWFVLLLKDSLLSILPKNLVRFPLPIHTLLAVRVLSTFISPVVMIVLIGTLMSLFPFLKSRHPVLGVLGLQSFSSCWPL